MDKINPLDFRQQLNMIRDQSNENVYTGENENEENIGSHEDTDKDDEILEPTTDNSNNNLDSADDAGDLQDSDGDHLKDQTIPYKRFNKEIQKRKALEAELQREKEEAIKAKTELDLINKALQKIQGVNDSVGTPDEKSFEPLDNEAHQTYMQKIQELENRIKHKEQQDYFEKSVNVQHEQFLKQYPDFNEAFSHLLKVEINAQKYLHQNESDALKAAMDKISIIGQRTFVQGKNVPETLYQIAKTYGFNAKQKDSTTKQAGPNIEAISKNIKKSNAADVNSQPLSPSGGAGNYTTLENFEKFYSSADPEHVSKFRKALDKIRKG
jgi:hypothetical protein